MGSVVPARSPRGLVRQWQQEIRARPPSRAGLLAALYGLWMALAPSLVPRQWWQHAVVVFTSVLLAYGAGLLLHLAWAGIRRLTGLRVSMSADARRWLPRAFYAALVLATAVIWWLNLAAQDQVAYLTRTRTSAILQATGGVTLGLVAAVALWFLARLWRALAARVARFGSTVLRLPGWVAGIVAWALVFTLVVLAPNNLLLRDVAGRVSDTLARHNLRTLPGRQQPLQPERSGSPASHETWSSLGEQGQGIVADGPTAAQVSSWSGRPAKEPIRVYAGLLGGRTLAQIADAVVAELDRTHAWDRGALVVVTTTGTGWSEEFSLAPIEYLTDGDSAIAMMQYSYLGSALAHLFERDTAQLAGRLLFDRVYAKWSTLPVGHRPKLYASGYSLGAAGGLAAFSSLDDMLGKVDGALWIGTPTFAPIWAEIVGARQGGSPEIAPVVDNGRRVRAVTRPEELTQTFYGAPYDQWRSPRVVFAAHASDPIVWWDPSLIWAEPDWLRERVGRDVNPSMSWIPWITFWQVSADMALSGQVAQGSGHVYQEELVADWAAVLDVTGRDLPTLAQAIRAHWRSR